MILLGKAEYHALLDEIKELKELVKSNIVPIQKASSQDIDEDSEPSPALKEVMRIREENKWGLVPDRYLEE